MFSRTIALHTTVWLSVLAIVGLASRSARAVELSDNLANVTSGTESATTQRWLAASFATDASTTYHLTSVTLFLGNPAPGTATLDLYSDGGLEPGALVATLSSPEVVSTVPAAATFNADGRELAANTTYWVVLRVISGAFEWAWTADNTGSGAGFEPVWDLSEDAGASWFTHAIYPLKLRVTVSTMDPIEDCNENEVPDDVDIQEGTSLDCNANATPDECDIASGVSRDCNSNGVPDSCDLASGVAVDCNSNGVPDGCDLASGTSQDCNQNGIPDSCDIASGTSEDCNQNRTPDSCDLASGLSVDVNGNGFPDDCEPGFLRSDSNCDGETDISDSVWTLNYLFAGGLAPCCGDSADFNDDGELDISDPIRGLNYLFQGGPAPPAPGATLPCGVDPTADDLDVTLPCEYPAEGCG